MILAVFGNAVLLLLLLLLCILIFQTFIPVISSAFAQEVITILPGSDKNRPRFLDITFYPIEKGKELTWFNDDNVEHSIVINSITEDNKTKLLTESEIIKQGDAFTYIFKDEGIYHFFSPAYPWIKGTIFVSNDISTVTKTDPKNDIDVQLSWTPSSPLPGQETHFKIIFINKETEENQKHIDYRFSIQDALNAIPNEPKPIPIPVTAAGGIKATAIATQLLSLE